MGHISVNPLPIPYAFLVFCIARKRRAHVEVSFMSEKISIKPIILDDTDGTQEGQFSLIHIPLSLYSALIQPILRVLLSQGGPTCQNETEAILEGLSVDNKHGLLNISVTPIECSVVC